MTNEERIERLRKCASFETCNAEMCDLWSKDDCRSILLKDAADALEAAEKRIAEMERILKAVQENSGINFRLWQEAEAQLPKEGEWLRTDAFPHRIYCSVCYKTYVPNDRWQIWVDGDIPKKFCPNCGAKMKTVTDCHTLEEG